MTAQQLLVASLDYKRILERTGVKLSEQTIRALNGQTEYMCAQAQIDEGECRRTECQSVAGSHDNQGGTDERSGGS